MNPSIWQFLSDMTREILMIVGVSYIPLIVLIIFRAGGLRGLTENNMAERLGDLCFDTIKEQINNKLEELLRVYFGPNFRLPPGLTIQEVGIHQDLESLEQLLTIFKNLTEFGVQSTEFLLILQHFF